MIYRRSLRFKKAYKSLPKLIQKKTAKSFILFQDNPAHPSLVVKKIQGHTDIWEGRIDNQYRFTFHYEKDQESDTTICVFRNMDNHDECLKNPQPKRLSFLKTETKKLACAEKALVGFLCSLLPLDERLTRLGIQIYFSVRVGGQPFLCLREVGRNALRPR